jgi:parallel beta-helix repeat protein
VDGWSESCVLVSQALNYTAGSSEICHNTFNDGTLTDIECVGIEAGGADNLKIEHNTITGAVTAGLHVQGSQNCSASNNTFIACCEDLTYPYGPFSERYAHDIGSSPVAGTSVAKQNQGIIQFGPRSRGLTAPTVFVR